MAEAEYQKIKEWAIKRYGKRWKKRFCLDIDRSQSIIAVLRRRRRLGLVTSMRISKLTGIPITELGFPELGRRRDG